MVGADATKVGVYLGTRQGACSVTRAARQVFGDRRSSSPASDFMDAERPLVRLAVYEVTLVDRAAVAMAELCQHYLPGELGAASV